MPVTFDAEKFLSGLNLADARAQRGGVRGIAAALAQVEKLAKDAVPIETGTLQGTIFSDKPSQFVVNEQRISGAIHAGGGEASDY